MKKHLPIAGITNELSGASAFFPRQTLPQPPLSTPPEPQSISNEPIQLETPAIPMPTNLDQQPASLAVAHQASMAASNHATMPPRHQEGVPPTMLETIRKVVKQVGKEAATHRFTEEEKRKLAELVYTYERQGYRTSENEITRIAVNWLLLEYAEQGVNSVLASLLRVLHE